MPARKLRRRVRSWPVFESHCRSDVSTTTSSPPCASPPLPDSASRPSREKATLRIGEACPTKGACGSFGGGGGGGGGGFFSPSGGFFSPPSGGFFSPSSGGFFSPSLGGFFSPLSGGLRSPPFLSSSGGFGSVSPFLTPGPSSSGSLPGPGRGSLSSSGRSPGLSLSATRGARS